MRKSIGVIWSAVACYCLITASLFAQAPDTLWTKTYGGTGFDGGSSVQECAGGGFIIAGYTNSFGAGGRDVWLIRTDAQGGTLWTKTYGGTGSDGGSSVQECASGGFIIAGHTNSFGAGWDDVYLIRTDEQGDTLWTKTYGGTDHDRGYSVQECASGGFIIVGETCSFGAGWGDVYLIRTDAQGDTLWTKTYGGTKWECGYSVQECASGGFIIAGRTRSFGAGEDDVYLIRTDAQGGTLWTKTYGGTDTDWGFSVQECASGGFIIVGRTRSFGVGGEDVYLIRTDAQGNTLWIKIYGELLFSEWGFSVQECASGGFIIAGWTGSFGAGGRDVWLIRTDAQGDTLWTKTYGGTGSEWGESVQECASGGFIIAGRTNSFGVGLEDVYLIRVGKEQSGIEERNERLEIKDWRLEVYPNPATTGVRIQWLGVSERERVSLKIYDLSGKLVKTIGVSAGYREIAVNLEELTNSIYFVKMEAGKFKATRKLTIIK
ncbi:MAG: T9SS type A sorting domain-containing protein [bacterium]|nr:T9SS type A sorting domain-containing protein [bacterium]